MKKTMNKTYLLAGCLWLCCCFNITAQCVPPTVSVQVQNNGSPLCQQAPIVLEANVTSSTVGITYQWKRNGVPIPTGTAPFLFVYEEGTYNVVVTKDSCNTTSAALAVTLQPPSKPIVSGTFDASGTILIAGCGNALVHAAPTRGGILEWFSTAVPTGLPVFTGTPYLANGNGTIHVFEKTAAGCYSPVQRILISLSMPPNTTPHSPDSLVSGRAIDENGVLTDTLRLPPVSSSCNLNTARVDPVAGDTILEWHTSRTGPSYDGNGNLISLLATGSSFTWDYFAALPISSYSNEAYKKAKIFVYKKINGCYGPPKPVVMTVFNPLVVTSSPVAVTCNGGSNGNILLGVTGDIAPYRFAWSRNSNITNPLNNLTAGTYQYTVTGAQGCTKSGSAVVTEPAALVITPTKTDITCNGLTNGSINLAVSGGTAPYTYSWANGATTQNLSNLSVGVYTVTVRDVLSCSTSMTHNLSQPILLTAAANVVTNATCGQNTGSINSAVTGGTPPYSYNWSNGATTADLTNLSAGIYSLTVTDSKGCTKTVTNLNITSGSNLAATITPTNASCGQTNGSIALTNVSGGTTYTYGWSANANNATTSSVSNLAVGDYSVTIASNGCQLVKTATISSANSNLTATITPTNASCGQTNGSIALTNVSGGTTYTYLWSANANNATTASVSNLAVGDYSVTIASNGCQLVKTATISSANSNLTATITPTNASCGQTNGSIALSNVSGGTTYTYIWSANANNATTASVNNLAVGTYSVTITSNGCQLVKTATISAGSNMTATANSISASCGNANGSVILSVTGGLSPYTYLWSNGATTISLNNVAAGSYTVTIKDANNCQITKTATVTSSSALSLTPTVTQPSCGQSNGSINLTVLGGTPSYNYFWSNSATTANLTNLAAGAYTVHVIDGAGCSADTIVNLIQSGGLVVNTIVNNALCGYSNGSVLTSVSGGTAPYTYSWSNGKSTANLSNLTAGTYTVTVTAANNCAGTKTVTVTGGSAITLTATVKNDSCNQSVGSITLGAEDGIKPYTFMWSTGATSQHLNNVPAGIYSVTVTDAVGCSQAVTKTIGQSCGGGSVANDNCTGSNLIAAVNNFLYIYPGLSARAITTGATASTSNTNQKDVWFKFSALAHSQVFRFSNILSTLGSCSGVGMEVYKGACGGLTSIFYDNQICLDKENEVFVGGNTATNYLNLNETYYVRVWTTGNSNNATGEFDIQLLRGSLNNICTYAEELYPWNITVTTGGSTTDPTLVTNSNTNGLMCNNNLAGAPTDDIWFKFTATASTMKLSYNSFYWRKGYCDPDKRLTFSLYDGGCNGAVVPFANNLAFGNKDQGDINIAGLTVGTKYYVKVWTSGSCNNYAIFNLKVNPSTSGGSGSAYVINTQQQLPVVVQSIYPVPTDEMINMQLTSKVNEPIPFQFYDARGSLVQTEEQTVQLGMNELHFDVSRLPSGVYYIMIPGVVLKSSPMQFVKL